MLGHSKVLAVLLFLWPCPLARPEELWGGGREGIGGEEEKRKHRNGRDVCSAGRPWLLLWLAEVQRLTVVGTDPSVGKRDSVALPRPGAVVGFVFNNLIFKGVFREFFT